MGYDKANYNQEGLNKTLQKHQITKMQPRYWALMRKMLAGKSHTEAGEELGYTNQMAYIISKSPLFIQEMEKMKASLDKEFIETQAKAEVGDPTRAQLNESTLKAAKALDQALQAGDINAIIRAANSVLDRTGYSKEEKRTVKALVEPSPGLLNALRREIPEEANVIDTEAIGEDKGEAT